MLPGDGAVVLNQRFHRLGQVDDLDVATELGPVAEEMSLSTHNQARGSRRTFKVFIAVSRVLTTRRSCESTPTSTGDIWGVPSRFMVARTACGFLRANASASAASISSASQSEYRGRERSLLEIVLLISGSSS